MPYVPQDAIEIFENGGEAGDVEGKVVNYHGDPASGRTARRWRLYWQQGIASPEKEQGPGRESEVTTEEMEGVFKLLKDKPTTLEALSEALDRSKSSVLHIVDEMESAGYNITRQETHVTVSTKTSVRPPDHLPGEIAHSQELKFGVLSDWHCGSIYAQTTGLLRLITYMRDQGVKIFIVPGDLTAGHRVYPGQEHDLFAFTAEEQKAAVKRALVPESDEYWLILGGNHDFAWIKRGGSDIIWSLVNEINLERGDKRVFFLGYDSATVRITDGFSVRLWHPAGGAPYSLSYRIQKGVEAIAYEQLNNLLQGLKESDGAHNIRMVCSGHLHYEAAFHRGGIFALQAACQEAQSPYLARKALYPELGGHIITFFLNDDGVPRNENGSGHRVTRDVYEYIQYPPIQDDWKNYPPLSEAGIGKPDEIEVLLSAK